MAAFEKLLDNKIYSRNFSYKHLVVNKAIEPLKIKVVRPNGFIDFLQHTGNTEGYQGGSIHWKVHRDWM